MILTTHALTGAVIGKNISNPWIIIILSLIIHFIMDSFRHGEYFDSRTATIKDTAWKIILDLSFSGVIILSFLFFYKPDFHITRNVLLGSFFSIFPDLLTVLFWKFKWSFLGRIKNFHAFCHRYSRFPAFSHERQWTLRNALNDILLSLIALVFIFL
ncbi:MAG: hypothetical protein WAV31_01785 [Candidatus Moraniibacteriota bacterium]